MKNTMDKREYITENIVWHLLVFIWFKRLFFKCLPGTDYLDSMLALLIIAILVTGTGIFATWKWGRNFSSVVGNVIMTWSLYVTIAYLEIIRNRIFVISIVTIIISVLMTIMVMTRRIKREDKRKQIIKSRVKSTIILWRKNLAIASLVLLVPIAVSVNIRGTIVNSSEVEVVEVYGDEHSLDANIEIISLIEPSRWDDLTITKKLDVMQKIINCECRYYGIGHEIYLGTAELSEKVSAYYSESQHQIVIDINHLDSDGYEVLKTVIHECIHAYQHEQVELYRSLDEKSRNLLMFYDTSRYMKEFDNGIDCSENVYGYYLQLSERNAREKAEEDSLEYIERINEYLNKQSE